MVISFDLNTKRQRYIESGNFICCRAIVCKKDSYTTQHKTMQQRMRVKPLAFFINLIFHPNYTTVPFLNATVN